MKPPVRLFLLAALPVAIAACAAPAETARPAASRTLEANRLLDVDLPSSGDTALLQALANRTFVMPVAGMTRAGVLDRLGAPSDRPHASLWIYRRHLMPAEASRHDGCDSLVVAFAHEKVLGMKLVRTADLETALAGAAPARRQAF